MSFKNSSLPIAKWVPNWAKQAPLYKTPLAVIDAARRNNTITTADMGVVGKKRQFKITYYPPVCDVEGSCTDTVCAPGEVLEPKQAFFELSECTASKVFQLNFADIRLTDDGGMQFSEHAKAQIASTMPSMRKLLSEQMQAKLIAHMGLQLDGNPTRRVSMVNGTNGVVNPLGRREIDRIFSDGGFTTPFIIGGTEVDNWIAATTGAGTNNAGNNLSLLSRDNMYYDGTLNEAFGDSNEHIIAFDPTVLKFISWSNNAGMFATDLTGIDDLDKLFKQSKDGGSIRGSLLDPVYGLLWDIRIKFFDCGGPDDEGYWTYQYKLLWDIFFMPDQVCNKQGVNGIFHFTSCPPVLAPCPTGDPVPAPAGAQSYEWTPALAYPLYVHDLQVAGITTQPNVNLTSLADLVAMLNENGGGIRFTKVGTTVQYMGYSAIGGNINGNTAFTFELS